MTMMLNREQREAVEYGDGPLLILAGAGSGKTRVITTRIASLLDRGVRPEQILAVTFTNKAADEMRHRVEKIAGPLAKGLWMGTFHSLCARFLRIHHEAAGLTKDFVIYDDSDQKSLVTRVLKDLGIADRFVTPRAVLSAIDGAKNKAEGPDEYKGFDYFTDIVARIYPIYEERLQQANAVDFGDLLLKVLWLCQKNKSVAERLGQRFEHVLVDEFQDTNRVQYLLVNHWSSGYRNLCVVGDDDQSIYGWRGANVRNILDFEHDHPGTHVIKLEQNYRSTEIILEAANHVIARNLERQPKKLRTEIAGGEPILYQTAETERDEAAWVARVILKLMGDDGRSPDEFAILYRTHAQSRAIEEALLQSDLPYTVIGGTRFYDRQEVKDLLAYMRVIQNPRDAVSLERILNRPTRGIGQTTIDRLTQWAGSSGLSLWDAILAATKDELGLGPGPQKKLSEFVGLIERFRTCGLNLADLAGKILDDTGYLERLAVDGSAESRSRIENLMELKGALVAAVEEDPNLSLADYLERVSLVSPADGKGRGVYLSTIHAAKGLEFPVVFIIGLEEGVFPSLRNGEDVLAMEEERRLAYVALTRARERIFLTNAYMRRLFGEDARPFRQSRFLDDIPEHCIARPVGRRERREELAERVGSQYGQREYDAPQRESVSQWGRAEAQRMRPRRADSVADSGPRVEYDAEAMHDAGEEIAFRLGQRVRHAQFGEGEVRGFTGFGANLKLTVYFPSIGPKTIVAKYVEAL